MRIRLFSHTDLDGISCNVLANIFFGQENVVATNHNYDEIDKAVLDFFRSEELQTYDYVFITDLSVSDETAEIIDGYIKSGRVQPQIILLDHHKSAERLNKYNWCTVKETISCDERVEPTCGTELFWMWFTSKKFISSGYDSFYISVFVQMVLDWDTWLWKTDPDSWGVKSKELNDLFYIFGKEEFVGWAESKLKAKAQYSLDDGWSCTEQILLDNRKKEIETYIKQKNSSLISYFIEAANCYVGVTFADRFVSELGNRLCELHPELDCIAVVNMSSGIVSLRSVREDTDVSEIAKIFGGGGHIHASGFTFKKNLTKDTITKIFEV